MFFCLPCGPSPASIGAFLQLSWKHSRPTNYRGTAQSGCAQPADGSNFHKPLSLLRSLPVEILDNRNDSPQVITVSLRSTEYEDRVLQSIEQVSYSVSESSGKTLRMYMPLQGLIETDRPLNIPDATELVSPTSFFVSLSCPALCF